MCKTFGFQAINTNTEDLMPDKHAAEFGGSTHAELDNNILISFFGFFLHLYKHLTTNSHISHFPIKK